MCNQCCVAENFVHLSMVCSRSLKHLRKLDSGRQNKKKQILKTTADEPENHVLKNGKKFLKELTQDSDTSIPFS